MRPAARRSRAASVLLALAALSACDAVLAPSAPMVGLRTDRSEYRSGDEGVLEIINFGSKPAAYACIFVQRRDGPAWQELGNYGECIIQAYFGRILEPGETLRVEFTAAAMFEEGHDYRFMFPVERYRMGRQRIEYSNPFRILEAQP